MTGLTRLTLVAGLFGAVLCLSGCYQTKGPVADASGEWITPLNAGAYCTTTDSDVSESVCFELAAAGSGTYVLTPGAGGENLFDTTPYKLYIHAQPLKTGAYEGYYVAEACRIDETHCTVGLIRNGAQDGFSYYVPDCPSNDCVLTNYQDVVTRFEALPGGKGRKWSGAVTWEGIQAN